MKVIRILTVAGAAIALQVAAYADESAAAPAAAAPPAPLAAFGASKPLTADELGDQRAKAKLEVEKLTVNAADQDGAVTQNVAIGNTTGRNSIGGAAFSSAAGFVNAIQNTGNNVLIQNSTIVNVSVDP